ncbi:hypothetical protein NDU88_001702 [Pleurodeles waltl]|uniref:Uncharacterized protein n=1 Tax=Pleurodeles waltl TaxID=8319 RepID=A0AAV7SBM5_PLEWA|nr:hypothetical protein NDU88_001702 [Pleurodeles waltl]
MMLQWEIGSRRIAWPRVPRRKRPGGPLKTRAPPGTRENAPLCGERVDAILKPWSSPTWDAGGRPGVPPPPVAHHPLRGWSTGRLSCPSPVTTSSNKDKTRNQEVRRSGRIHDSKWILALRRWAWQLDGTPGDRRTPPGPQTCGVRSTERGPGGSPAWGDQGAPWSHIRSGSGGLGSPWDGAP